MSYDLEQFIDNAHFKSELSNILTFLETYDRNRLKDAKLTFIHFVKFF